MPCNDVSRLFVRVVRYLLSFIFLSFLSFELYAGSVVGYGVRDAIDLDKEVIVSISLDSEDDTVSGIDKQQRRVLSILDESEYQILQKFKHVAGMQLLLKNSSALDRLSSHPSVKKIDLEEKSYGTLAVTVPHIRATMLHSGEYNNINLTGKGVTVAVVDTGVNFQHPDLVGKASSEYCHCSGGSGCCPLGGNNSEGTGSASDDNGHGTHVAGIIASQGTSDIASTGVAPGVSLVAIKTHDEKNRSSSSSDVVATHDWLIENIGQLDISIINMSIGTDQRFIDYCDYENAWATNWFNALEKLRRLGITVIVSSGNDSDKNALSAPACFSNTIAVGSTGKIYDEVPSYSNSSEMLDILAPGVGVSSTSIGGGVTIFSGTSMSAPHVSGVAALLKEFNPQITPALLKTCLTDSLFNVEDVNGITRPRVDAVSAMSRCEQELEDNQAPMASAGPSIDLSANQRVSLNGSSSFDPDNDPLSYYWVQIGGPTVKLNQSDSAMPNFVVPSLEYSESVVFRLTVDDGKLMDSVVISHRINADPDFNSAPVALTSGHLIADSGENVFLDGGDSYDPDGQDLHYSWEQIAGPSVTLTGRGNSRASFIAPNEDAILIFSLTVSDGRLSSSADVSVTVKLATSVSANSSFLSSSGGASASSGGGSNDLFTFFLLLFIALGKYRFRANFS